MILKADNDNITGGKPPIKIDGAQRDFVPNVQAHRLFYFCR